MGGDLHDRIAKALGWSVKDTQSMSMHSLRDLVRPVDPALAQEMSYLIQSGAYIRSKPHHATIRKGTRGKIVNVDNSQRAAFFDGAKAIVKERWYRPDMVVVELLDDGPGWPGGTWKKGAGGAVELRYFVPDKRRQ